MADVRGHRVEARLAATLATLATAQLKAVQAADLEERVANLEQKVQDAATQGPPSVMTDEQFMVKYSESPDDSTQI